MYGYDTLTCSAFEKSQKFIIDGALGQTVSDSSNAISAIILNGGIKNGFGKFSINKLFTIPEIPIVKKNYVLKVEKQ